LPEIPAPRGVPVDGLADAILPLGSKTGVFRALFPAQIRLCLQYAGRLHGEHASKTDVRIIDFVDTGHPALLRMWEKRPRCYRAMGYRVETLGEIGEIGVVTKTCS